MVFNPFSSEVPTDRNSLFELAAKKLPWKVTESGWAYLTIKETEGFTGRKKEIYEKILVQPEALKQRESKSAGGDGKIMAVYDAHLESDINERKNLGADAATKKENAFLYGDEPTGPSGADCLKRSDGKGHGRPIS